MEIILAANKYCYKCNGADSSYIKCADATCSECDTACEAEDGSVFSCGTVDVDLK